MKKTKSSFPIELILIILSLLMFVFYILFVRYYYARILDTTENETGTSYRTFSRQYEMIADSRSNTFWQALYARAAEKAAEADAYVSLNQTGWNTAYDKLDYIDMFIASQVDGIILEYNGEEGLAEKIDEAVAQGIPVVTIINDPNRTQRQSFVGVNDYQLGIAYGGEVARLADENTHNILVLSNREKELEKNQMYAQIYKAVTEAHPGQNIRVKEQNLNSRGQFDVEEAVRNIFQSVEGMPEILVCLDEVTTECAYQAMVDFNLVGDVKIIGFYTSDTILDAVQKGLIPVTIYMDADQIGTYCIEALTEYAETGRSNTYYTVDLHSLTTADLTENKEKEASSGEVQDG